MEAMLAYQNSLKIWDPFIKGDLKKVDFCSAIQFADAVIFCTPTEPIFELSQKVGSFILPHAVSISMAKALDKKGRTAAQALDQGLPHDSGYAVLYGPMIAEEIIAGRPAFATVAGSSQHALEVTKSLFDKTVLKLQEVDDVNGVAWCAVLKNVYAMLFGMADELRLGANVRGYLAVSSLQEMADILRSVGGNPATPYSLAGLGDLITTGTSEDSHHHELGRMIVREEREHLEGAGISTLDTLASKQTVAIESYPIMHTIWRIMRNNEQAKILIEQLMAN